MKFRIRHETQLFQSGIVIPWFAAIAAVLLFVLLEFTIENTLVTMILIGILALCAVAEIVFVLLFAAEKIWGAKIIVESDHLDIRMFLRRRKLLFDDIEDVKYRHYECGSSNRELKQRSNSLLTKYFVDDEVIRIRSKLTFYLASGRTLTLNDDAPGYEQKRRLWITEPDLDPDEDVKLYQAYLCYRSACRQYYNSK